MQSFARVQGGVVQTVTPIADGLVPGVDVFTPEMAANMHPCHDAVQTGWNFVNGTFTAPVVSVSGDGLRSYARERRYAAEVAGVSVGGVTVATDDRSKTLLLGARMAAEKDAAFTTPWSAADGTEHVLTAAEIIGISDAVLAHVATCFSTYSTVAASIANGTITTTAEIDAAFPLTA